MLAALFRKYVGFNAKILWIVGGFLVVLALFSAMADGGSGTWTLLAMAAPCLLIAYLFRAASREPDQRKGR